MTKVIHYETQAMMLMVQKETDGARERKALQLCQTLLEYCLPPPLHEPPLSAQPSLRAHSLCRVIARHDASSGVDVTLQADEVERGEVCRRLAVKVDGCMQACLRG